MFRKFGILSIGLLFIAAGSWLVVKHISTTTAQSKAIVIIAHAYKTHKASTPDEKVIAITREIFKSFTHKNPAEVLFLRPRAYLTNHRLPSWIGLPDGVIETNIETGLCDNAARMLAFVLKQEGFESVQWNMVTNSGGHSALLVSMPDGRKILADPFYGVVTIDKNDRLIHPKEAQNRVQSGEEIRDIFRPLGEKSKLRFYKQANSMRMAAAGEDMILEASLPSMDKDPVFLGEINGSEKDVKSAAIKKQMIPYWYYMGHKYNREWVRILKATQPVRIEMTLIAPAEKGVLITTPAPTVSGNKLVWELGSEEQIIFRDGLAKISLKRMNSYIGVDQIALYPLN